MRALLVLLLLASPLFAANHDEPAAPAAAKGATASRPISRDPQSEDLEALKGAILELSRFNPQATPKSLEELSHPVGEQKAAPGTP